MIEWKRQLPYGGQEYAGIVSGTAEGITTITVNRPEVRRPGFARSPRRP